MHAPPVQKKHAAFSARPNDENLISEVLDVVSLMMPRSILTAGFSENGEVLLMHHGSYAQEFAPWNRRFFEQEAINEPLFAGPQAPRGIFVLSQQNMLVPQMLFDEKHAESWLSTLYLAQPSDEYLHYTLPDGHATHCAVVPEVICALHKQFFSETALRPASAFQFYKPTLHGTGKASVQILLAGPTAVGAMYVEGKLVWHQSFPFSTGADVAWQVLDFCTGAGISQDNVRLTACSTTPDCFGCIQELREFFPGLTYRRRHRAEDGHWAPVIYLAQQLYACAL